MPKPAVGKLLKKKKKPSAGKLAEKAESGKKLSIKDKKLLKKAGAKGKKGSKVAKKVEPEKKKKTVKKSKKKLENAQHIPEDEVLFFTFTIKSFPVM